MKKIEDFLPVLCDEIVIETENYLIKKIAQFDYEATVHIFGDEWHIRPEWKVEYVVYDGGKKIKPYEPDKDTSCIKSDETISEGADKFISDFQSEYCRIEVIGNGIYCVETDNGEDLNTIKLVDSKNQTISESFHDIYMLRPLCITQRWVDGQHYSGLMDKFGKIIIEGKFWIPATHQPSYWEKRRRIVFCKDNRFGVVNFDGELVVAPKYKDIACIMAELVVAINDKGYVLLAEDGTELMTARDIGTSDDKIIVCEEDNEGVSIYQYIKKKNFEVPRFLAEEILDFTSDEKDYEHYLRRDKMRKMLRE